METIQQSSILKRIIEFNSTNVNIGVSRSGYGLTHFTKRNFRQNEIVVMGFGKPVKKQTSHFSIQIGYNTHFIPGRWTGKYWNHSCAPNCFVNSREDGFPNLFAMKDIPEGTEITYSYSMTEFSWCEDADENSIECLCGSPECRKKILSFSELTRRDQAALIKANHLSRYLVPKY